MIARSLGGAARLGDVEIGRVVYKPGDTLAVHYRAVVDGEPRDAVATRIAGVDLVEQMGRDAYEELARKAEPRSVAPARVDPELGALVTWLPFDPRLPALAEDPGELEAAARPAVRRRAGAAGLQAARAGGAARERARASRPTARSASSRRRWPACAPPVRVRCGPARSPARWRSSA